MKTKQNKLHSSLTCFRLFMDNFKKTPTQKGVNTLKACSGSKRFTPNLNTTVSSAFGSGSKRFPSNHQQRRNLDVTLCGASSLSTFTLKGNLTAPSNATDHDLQCDLAYNDYLQSLLRQQVVTENIRKQKEVLKEQIVMQSERLHKLKCTYEEITSATNELNTLSEVVEIMNFLEENMSELKALCARYDIDTQLNILYNILLGKSNFLTLKNIKPIKTQEEYDRLITVLKSTNSAMEKIVNSGRNFSGINELAEYMRDLLKLKKNVEERNNLAAESQKETVYGLLQYMSDMFASKGGYDQSTQPLFQEYS